MDPTETSAPPVGPSVLAGAIAAQLGAVGFWLFHDAYIAKVPAVLVEGILWAGAAGSAVGWAFHHLHLRGRFSAGAGGGLLLGVTLWLLLVPFEIIGLLVGPLTHLTRPAELAMLVPVGLLAAPLGGLVGWALTRDRRAAGALATAATLSHFMMGGSLVYFGGRGPLLVLFLLALPTHLAAGLVFVRLRRAFLARRARERLATPDVTP